MPFNGENIKFVYLLSIVASKRKRCIYIALYAKDGAIKLQM